MSDKQWKQLLAADRMIRDLSPGKDSMRCGPQVRITLVRGFELFNTRPYHNYENWASGYEIEAFDESGDVIAKARREDLDDALQDLRRKLAKIGKHDA